MLNAWNKTNTWSEKKKKKSISCIPVTASSFSCEKISVLGLTSSSGNSVMTQPATSVLANCKACLSSSASSLFLSFHCSNSLVVLTRSHSLIPSIRWRSASSTWWRQRSSREAVRGFYNVKSYWWRAPVESTWRKHTLKSTLWLAAFSNSYCCYVPVVPNSKICKARIMQVSQLLRFLKLFFFSLGHFGRLSRSSIKIRRNSID